MQIFFTWPNLLVLEYYTIILTGIPHENFAIIYSMAISQKKALLAILTACPVLLLFGSWLFFTVNVPYWDDYEALLRYLTEPWPNRWSHLLDFHNEHRIVTTRLIADALVALNAGTFNFRAMIAVGNLIQLAYVAVWVFTFRKSRLGIAASLPVLWLLLSFIHYENSCWALCSVQNVIVVALSFAACLLFAKRNQSRFAFAGAMLCGVAATFSSGGGLLVWPSLFAMELAEPITEAGSWRYGLANIIRHAKASAARLSLLAIVAASSIGCYLHGFSGGTTEQVSGTAARVINGTLFFIAFLGGIVPLYPAALAFGVALLPLLVFIMIRYPQIRHTEVFWFMAAEIATMLSAAVFRSSDPHAAVSSRYCIVSCSVFASIFFLGLEVVPLPEKLAKWGLVVATCGVILYTTVFLVLASPLYAQRNELMRRNLLTWPNHTEGLRSSSPESASELLRKCVERGVYNPTSVLKPGETPPKDPEPWLR